MNARALAIPLLAVALALAVGWAAPGLPPPPISVASRPHAQALIALPRPDEATAAAVRDLTGELGGAPPAPQGDVDAPPPRAAPPPSPPPPDVVVSFRRQVTAVIDQGPGGLAVLMRDSSDEATQSRLLKLGDRFGDGWRLAGLTMDGAVLQKGRELRRVPFYGGV